MSISKSRNRKYINKIKNKVEKDKGGLKIERDDGRITTYKRYILSESKETLSAVAAANKDRDLLIKKYLSIKLSSDA